MVITPHYVDAHWDMKNVITAFIRVMYPHTGKRLADHLVEAVKSMDPMMLESVWAITADNASCNSTMIDQINGILQQAINENFEQNLLIDEEEDGSLSTNYIETVLIRMWCFNYLAWHIHCTWVSRRD